MEQFLKEAGAAKGKNAKQDLVKAASPRVKAAIVLALDPFQPTYIKKLPKLKAHSDYAFDHLWQDFCILFHKLTTRELSGNAAKDAIVEFLERGTPEAQDAFTRILKKDLKVGIQASTVNKAMGGKFVPVFNVQLANKYEPNKSYKGVDHWWASRKLNGLRGYWSPGKPMRSRKGHPFFGFDHIIAELEQLKDETGIDFADGELYNHHIPFQTIQGYVRGSSKVSEENKRKIFFNIFAIGHDKFRNTADMVAMMRDIDWSKYLYLRPVEYHQVENNPIDIEYLMNEMYDKGYEGLMLRHPTNYYMYKRSNELLKYKPFHEADFKIVGVQLGEPDGRFSDTCGTIVIEGYVNWGKGKDAETRFVRCEVGSGFSEFSLDRDGNKFDTPQPGNWQPRTSVDGEVYYNKLDWDDGDWGWQEKPTRDWMWFNRERLIDLKAEIQFQTFSDEPDENGIWALQFPTFRALKLDR